MNHDYTPSDESSDFSSRMLKVAEALAQSIPLLQTFQAYIDRFVPLVLRDSLSGTKIDALVGTMDNLARTLQEHRSLATDLRDCTLWGAPIGQQKEGVSALESRLCALRARLETGKSSLQALYREVEHGKQVPFFIYQGAANPRVH